MAEFNRLTLGRRVHPAGDFVMREEGAMEGVIWSLVVKLIASILSPFVEWIQDRIARIWPRKLKGINLNGEYRNDEYVFRLEAKLEVLAMGFFDPTFRTIPAAFY
jgi:hypothetical protein